MDDVLPGVRIRAVILKDLPDIYQYQRDPQANRMAKVHPRSATDFDAHWRSILADPTVTVRTVLVDGLVAGCVCCFSIHDHYHIGYWIGRQFWSKGVATRSLRLLLEEVTLRPISARVAVENVASTRVLQKCGFVEVGREWSPETDRLMECEEVIYQLKE